MRNVANDYFHACFSYVDGAFAKLNISKTNFLQLVRAKIVKYFMYCNEPAFQQEECENGSFHIIISFRANAYCKLNVRNVCCKVVKANESPPILLKTHAMIVILVWDTLSTVQSTFNQCVKPNTRLWT